MDISYRRTIWRVILKNMAFTAINVLGLALGLFCAIIILLWINYESGFDKFHENYGQLFHVVNNWGNDKDNCCPGALAAYVKENYPEVKNASTYSVDSHLKLSFEQEKNWFAGGMADSSFFQMFSFPFIQGSESNPFPEPNSAVITSETAGILYGDANPSGKPIKMEYEDMVLDLIVAGVIEDIPENSSLKFDFLISSAMAPPGYFAWTNNWPDVFIQLEENSSASELGKQIKNLAKQHDKEAINSFELKAFKEEHLYSNNGGGLIVYMRVFGLIAVVILCIACFNYMNLSTAQMSDRQLEVAIKKTNGFSASMLRKQYMLEVSITSLLSFMIALMGIRMFLPLVNNILNKNIAFELNPWVIGVLLAIMLITIVLSGLYPAFYLASINPMAALKNLTMSGSRKQATLRQVLVISQFTFSIALIACLIGLYKQLDYIKNKDMGFDTEGIVIVPLQGKTNSETDLICEQLSKNPEIIEVSASAFHPVLQEGETSFVDWKESTGNENVSTKFNYVDYGYLETFGLKMEEGRFFQREYADDHSINFVVNEKLTESMGLKNPVGKQMALFGDYYGTIIGVIKNFHNEPLYNDIYGYTLMLGNEFNYLSVKIAARNVAKTIDFIEETLKGIEPSFLFSYQFLEEEIASKYYREKLIGKLTIMSAALSIIISFLGLFGLVLFTIKKHSKEIGIRKVNGANTMDILLNLNVRFLKWLLLSFVLACPLSYFAIRQWLKNFAFKTTISWWIFIGAGIVVFVLSFLIVSVQSWRYVRQNPVDAIRYE
jgi:putative ABC transport system permease protein